MNGYLMMTGVFMPTPSSNLHAMEEAGLVRREVYAEVPPRVEYSLTELGLTLKPVLDALWAWGEDYQKAVGKGHE